MANSRLIVVLGMHRSGTSAVTRALQVMNVDLGDRLMPAAEGDNPKGFFEDTDIYALNVEMLQALEIDWFSLTPVDDHDVETLKKMGYFLRAVELLKSKCELVPVFAFKDPRIAKLLTFWKAVFNHCQFDVSYVITVRHPRSVAKSLSHRNDFDLEKGYLLWLDHIIKILMFTKEDQCVYIDYDKLIETPDAQVKRLATALRLQVNAAKLKSFKSGFLDRSLRHTAFTVADLEIDHACPPLVRDTYTVLAGLADASLKKSGQLSEIQLTQWVAEFSRLKSTLLYVDRLAAEKSNIALKLFVPSRVFQVFFDMGTGFLEADSVRIDTAGTALATEFVVNLPQSNRLLGLRIDPLDDFVAIRTPEMLLINESDDVIDLLPFSRPDAVVSAEGVHFFHTQDPAIYFDLPAEMLDTAKRLKITFSYVATGTDAQMKYADYCHARREYELQTRLIESQDQMQQLERGLNEKAAAVERQLAQEKELLVTQHLQVERELRDAHAAHGRETQQRLSESQDQVQQLESALSEKAAAVERQLKREKELLDAQHLQVEKQLREVHATREHDLQERLDTLQEQTQQFERGLSEKAGAAQGQLAREKELLVGQHAQIENGLREAHVARERELLERLLESQGQMQQLERGLSERAGATERQLAREKELLVSQHVQAEKELQERLLESRDQMQHLERSLSEKAGTAHRQLADEKALLVAQFVQAEKELHEAHANRERDWSASALAQERQLAQQKALLDKDVQALQEKLHGIEREKALIVIQHAQMESIVSRGHFARERELRDRLLVAQEQLKKQEQERIENLVHLKSLHAQERLLLDNELQVLQENVRSGEREKAVLGAQRVEVEKNLNFAHFTRERVLHEQLLAAQEETQKQQQQWGDKTDAQDLRHAAEKALYENQLQALREQLERGEAAQTVLADKNFRSESSLAEMKLAQGQAATALQQLTQKHAQVLIETGQRFEKIKTAWFWRPLAPLSAATRPFIEEAFAASVAPLQFVNQNSNDIEKSPFQLPSKKYNFRELIAYEGSEFIEFVYLAILGRKPDSAGLRYYLNRLEKFADKRGIIYQIYLSPEAQKLGRNITGLKKAMRREKIKRVLKIPRPLHSIFKVTKPDRECPVDHRTNIKLISSEVESEDSSTEILHSKSEVTGLTVDSITGVAYLPEAGNALAEVDRCAIAKTAASESGYTPHNKVPTSGRLLQEVEKRSSAGLKNISSYFMEPAENQLLQSEGYTFTRLMLYVWNSRLDLQRAFDINSRQGRIDYAIWFLCTASKEYGLTPKVYPVDLLEKLASFGGEVQREAMSMMKLQHTVNRTAEIEVEPAQLPMNTAGANLIGYAFGEFGMGEHVRMVARSLNKTSLPFCVLDQAVGVHGAGDLTVQDWVVSNPQYSTNVFHVNADVFPPLYFKFGEAMFADRYNIGYWAWELAKCPEEFDVALNMVDEVWAISDFVANSFKTRAVTDVITMPLAVTVPTLDSSYTKKYYNLPEDSFIFLFTFDAASYLDRKNPIAAVRAFRLAFPLGSVAAHLVLKTMNIDLAGPMWDELVVEAELDARIIIITSRMGRSDVLGLNLACDAFISLHRSEGFGRCVAEAMAYGKPVIVTNYSGTCDFANEFTACLVDFKLVPVPHGMYPFAHDQFWAEPDIGHAAKLMVLLATDSAFRNKIASAGQKCILENFNETVIGARYAKRVKEIAESQLLINTDLPAVALLNTADEFAGCIDAPVTSAACELGDSLPVEGWVVSRNGISRVDIRLNSNHVGRAHYGLIRNDIHSAYSTLPNAARSGFCYLLDTSVLSEGRHEVEVSAISPSGEVKRWVNTFSVLPSTRYASWLAKNELSWAGKSTRTVNKPSSLFSLVLRTSPTTRQSQLERTLVSLKAQRGANFEIALICADVQKDSFVRVFNQSGLTCRYFVIEPEAVGLSVVLATCSGNLLGIIDAGSEMQRDVLAFTDSIFKKNRRLGIVYGDEDQICEGVRSEPIFKPGWSPVFLENYNYIGTAWFCRTSLVKTPFFDDVDPIEKLDEHTLLKRVSKRSHEVGHIPSILVSTDTQTRPFLKQVNGFSELMPYPSIFVSPKVSIVIPTCLSDMATIERCFDSLVQLTDYPEVEVIIIFNNVMDSELIEFCTSKWPFSFLYWDAAFSWAAINNFGASKASGSCLLFMNDDVEPVQKSWLQVLVHRLLVTNAGAVGPLLLYPNDTVQHAGMYVNPEGGNVRHFFRFAPCERTSDHWLMKYPRDVSAVTGACLLTTKACFDSIGGFDEDLPLVCNDTDYCFRLGAKGFPVVIEPGSKLIHHEGVSRAGMSEGDDVARFRLKWKNILKRCDQFSNPNIDNSRDDWRINGDFKQSTGYRIFKSRVQGAPQ